MNFCMICIKQAFSGMEANYFTFTIQYSYYQYAIFLSSVFLFKLERNRVLASYNITSIGYYFLLSIPIFIRNIRIPTININIPCVNVHIPASVKLNAQYSISPPPPVEPL